MVVSYFLLRPLYPKIIFRIRFTFDIFRLFGSTGYCAACNKVDYNDDQCMFYLFLLHFFICFCFLQCSFVVFISFFFSFLYFLSEQIKFLSE